MVHLRRRAIASVLLAGIVQVAVAGQPRGEETTLVNRHIDVELRDGRHVTGVVATTRGHELCLALSAGGIEWVAYSEIVEIRDVETGLPVAMLTPRPAHSAKRRAITAAIVAGVVGGAIWLYVVTGCFGSCHY